MENVGITHFRSVISHKVDWQNQYDVSMYIFHETTKLIEGL